MGRIGTTDFIETDADEELFTVPEEAKEFVEQTKVDALAVSVGTAHGVYMVRQPRIDFERVRKIRRADQCAFSSPRRLRSPIRDDQESHPISRRRDQ